MKRIQVFSAAAVLAMSACESMNRPLSSGEFDPLRPPGSDAGPSGGQAQAFSAGQFVRASMDNTAFFSTRPRGDMDADKLLRRGTSMKVISPSDSYTKVELDSGEVGWVPTILLEDPNAPAAPYGVNPGEYQVYPPPTGFETPYPPTNPADLPPGGAIPTVIDPEAPSVVDPVPPVTPAPPAPPVNPSPAPLPPNGEGDGDAVEVPPSPVVPADPPVEATPRLEQ